MNEYEVSREDLMAELKKELEAGKSLYKPSYKVRLSKPMNKEEFSNIRKELKVTQAQLAEILDISIKTVQAYEQGRAEIPGLVAKVLRLMWKSSVFRALFHSELADDDYSNYANVESVIIDCDAENSVMKLTESTRKAFEVFRSERKENETISMTAIEDFTDNNR